VYFGDRAPVAACAGPPLRVLFAGGWTLKNPLNSATRGATTVPRDQFRWSVWAKALSGEALVRFMRDEVFAFFGELGRGAAHDFMKGARLTIDDPTVLTQVITLVDGLRLDASDSDTKGDLFEHVLRQIRQAGELGQFRTPRHVIRTIVEMIDPKVGETIYDPAAGTAAGLPSPLVRPSCAFQRCRVRASMPAISHTCTRRAPASLAI
jgi:type I restriction enzyme M protein